MPAEMMGVHVVNGVINLINSQLARQATERLEDKRREFQKWQQINNQEFQREQFEKQKQLQKELAEHNRQTQLQVALEQRNTARQVVQDQKMFQNWPLRIVPDQILNACHDENLLPLRIIPVPPVIDFDQFSGNNKSFPNIETGLAQGLREFFNQHYPFQSSERPIQLIGGGWDSKRYHGESAIIGLFALLKCEPMLILESQIDGEYLHLNVGYWGEGQQRYFYQAIISNLPYREIVYESVKLRARQWQEKREQLAKQLNKSLEEIDRQYGGDNPFNLKILQEEEALKSAGIDRSDLATQPYKVTAKDFEYLCQFLVRCQSLVGGWVADIHHLIQHNISPILPKLLPDLMRDIHDPKLLNTIVSGYRQVYQALENERPAWMPELALDLANSLKYLPDKSWAKEQVKASIQSWLRVRGVTPPAKMEEGIAAMKSVMGLEDEEYFTALQDCLREIEEGLAANQVKGLLDEYAGAEDRCQRAIALWKAGQLREAMRFLDSAIERYPDYPKIQQLRQQVQAEMEAETDCDRVMALWKAGQMEEAMRLLESARQRYPDNPKIRQLRRQLAFFEFETVTVNRQGQIIKREKKQAQGFPEDLGKGVTIEMVAIPGGEFLMRSPEGQGYSGEHPQHQVTVPPFFMGKFQVTQKQWRAVASLPKVERYLNPEPSHFKGDNRPVEQVSWNDAVEFCRRLSKKAGREYRLPSEAEWEYACKAGTATPFYFGETITTDLANYNGNYTYGEGPKGRYRQETSPVGQFPPNGFGIYDMHGNVWEWCQDDCHETYKGAPRDGSAWLNKNNSPQGKCLRGGSWNSFPANCRSAYRTWRVAGFLNDYIGFRVVCGVPGLFVPYNP